MPSIPFLGGGGQKGLFGNFKKKLGNENTLQNMATNSTVGISPNDYLSTRATLDRRVGIDPEVAGRYGRSARNSAQEIGQGTYNRLRSAFGSSGAPLAGLFNSAGAAGRAQGDAFTSFMLPFEVANARQAVGERQGLDQTALQLQALIQSGKIADKETLLRVWETLRRRGDIEAGKGSPDILGQLISGGAQLGAAALI